MGKNFKELPCPFCGRIIRNSDKFCIFCGSKIDNQDQPSKPSMSKEEQKEVDDDLIPTDKGEKDDTKSSNKRDKKSTKTSDDKSKIFIEMPAEIKEQLTAKMDLAVLNNKKERLRDKLRELTQDLDAQRYEYDLEYAKIVNTKLDAVKGIKQELFAEEETLRGKLGPTGQFRMDELDTTMQVQRNQLLELKRQFKRHKIKKDVYKQLKEEYVDIFRNAEEELQNLRNNVIRWVSEERSKKATFENQIQILKARFKAGEMEEKDLDQETNRLGKQIESIEQKIKILDLYSESKKNGFFK